jgi:hypothetical protein
MNGSRNMDRNCRTVSSLFAGIPNLLVDEERLVA